MSDELCLQLWMNLLMSIVEHGLCWMGPPCSSFVILCLAQSQRWDWNDWWGDTCREFVRTGSMHMQIAALFFLLLVFRGYRCVWATFKQLHVPTTSNVLSLVICQSQQDHNISWSFLVALLRSLCKSGVLRELTLN